MNSIEQLYKKSLLSESDIQGHLQFIANVARGNVLEMGVRSGNSTAAFLYGLEMQGGKLWSIDKNALCGELFNGHPLWNFINADSCDVATVLAGGVPSEIDILFLDTMHDYEQVSNELVCWHTLIAKNGIILVHDVSTFSQGAGSACINFAKEYGWKFAIRDGSNGLGIISKEI